MRSAAYDLAQFEPPSKEIPVRPALRAVDNPKRKRSYRVHRLRLAVCSAALFALMALTVYNNMLLTETRAKVVSRSEELTRLNSEYSYLNCELENMVSLKNAADYAENELGLIKVSASQIEYVNLHGDNRIVEGDEGARVNIFLVVSDAIKGLFAGQGG